MRILLHTCCGVCTIGPFRELSEEGHEVVGHFHNPNIHPLIEFRRRLKAQKVVAERLSVEMVYEEQYGLREYLEKVDWRGEGRCADCYRLRLARTAGQASEGGFDAFSTTMLASAHQKHELVRQVGRQCGGDQGVEFVYRDWRPLAQENHDRASELRLYLQQYCGCVFSEFERFKDTTKHLYERGCE